MSHEAAGQRLAVVGLGRQGARHVRVARQLGLPVVGTVDPAARGTDSTPHFETVEEAIDVSRPSMAIVATPSFAHLDAAMTLIDAGIPTLIEKPLAPDPIAAQRIVEAAARARGLVVTGHVERFNPAVTLVRRLLRAGSLGEPIACSFRRVGLPPVSPPDVDVIMDLAVHDIDVFGALSAAEPELHGASGWAGSDQRLESAHVLLGAGQVHGMIEVNWRTPVRLRSFVLTTDRCLVEVDYTSQSVSIVEASDVREFEEFAAFRSHYGMSKRTLVEHPIVEPLLEQLRAFVAGVVKGELGDLASADDGLRAVSVAHAASQLAATRTEHP